MITVVGSFTMNLTALTERLPVPGETMLGASFNMSPGGKGSDQAIAASRLGSDVTIVTRIGKDYFGRYALEHFRNEGIAYEYITFDDRFPTGATLITEDLNGDKTTVITHGACENMTAQEICSAERAIASAKALLIQLETNDDAIITTIFLANKHNVPVILNPAPFRAFPMEILKGVTYATPNTEEASAMSGVNVVDEFSALAAAEAIHANGVKRVILTMGVHGCLVYEDQFNYSFVSAFDIDHPVDTSGAGDAFNGGFAHAIARGDSLLDSVRFASAVAGCSATRKGTAQSMPRLAEVEDFILSHSEIDFR